MKYIYNSRKGRIRQIPTKSRIIYIIIHITIYIYTVVYIAIQLTQLYIVAIYLLQLLIIVVIVFTSCNNLPHSPSNW